MAMILAAFSGFLTALALPNELFPSGSSILGVICVVPYFIALHRARSIRTGALLGAIYGAVSTASSNYWLAFFQDFSVWTLGGTTLGYALIHALLAPALMRMLREDRLWRPFAVAMVWAAYEYLKSVGFLAYPWGLLAYPPSNILLYIQHIEITGIWSLSFMTAAANAVIAEAFIRGGSPGSLRSPRSLRSPGSLRSPRSLRVLASAGRFAPTRLAGTLGRQAAFVVLLIGIALLFGVWRFANPIPVSGNLSLIMVQQNIDQWRSGQEEPSIRRGQELTREALRATTEAVDLVAWSETSLQRPYPEYREFYRRHPSGDPFLSFLRDIETPFLTGAPVALDREGDETMNGAILLSPSGERSDYYGKQHLVPFAEHIPFWNLQVVRDFYRNTIGLARGWSVGTEYRLFDLDVHDEEIGRVRIGTPICFEDSFGYLARGFVYEGADVLVNLTNNAWSRTESAQIQHFVSARFRSIENRTALARSTNSGLTAVVDAYGTVTEQVPMFEASAVRADVPIYDTDGATLYTRYSDWLGRLLTLGTGLLIVWLYIRDRRAGRL
ncbi:MAG: apolipoprotein N-acyltransferase [Spirochaetia bacterium]